MKALNYQQEEKRFQMFFAFLVIERCEEHLEEEGFLDILLSRKPFLKKFHILKEEAYELLPKNMEKEMIACKEYMQSSLAMTSFDMNDVIARYIMAFEPPLIPREEFQKFIEESTDILY